MSWSQQQGVLLTTTEQVMAVIDSLDHSDYNCASSAPLSPVLHAEPSEAVVLHKKKRKRYWTDEEDELLLRLVEKEGMHWRRFLPLFPDTSDDAIRNRWKRLTTEGDTEQKPREPRPPNQVPVRVAWTVEEDTILTQAVLSNTLNSVLLARHPRSSWRNRIHRLGLDEAYRECHKRYRSSTSLSWETTDALKDEFGKLDA